MADQTHEPLLTTAEVARQLRVSRATVYRLIQSGRLRASRVSPRTTRVHREDVAELLRRGRHQDL